MWGQTDLKKLIAYGTVQEMNMIFLLFCWGDSNALWGGILFCITHSFLSGLLFYTVDCVQRRFHTRNIIELSGILQTHPNLGLVIFFNCVLYSGLPGTLKFICELYLYVGLLENSFFLGCILFFSCNYLGLVGFCKCWYNVLFGLPLKSKQVLTIDLTMKEILIIFSCYFALIFVVFTNNLIFL
jgi:NADH:ubiquinone oxidoreductase subunit 4 (subunit M)